MPQSVESRRENVIKKKQKKKDLAVGSVCVVERDDCAIRVLAGFGSSQGRELDGDHDATYVTNNCLMGLERWLIFKPSRVFLVSFFRRITMGWGLGHGRSPPSRAYENH